MFGNSYLQVPNMAWYSFSVNWPHGKAGARQAYILKGISNIMIGSTSLLCYPECHVPPQRLSRWSPILEKQVQLIKNKNKHNNVTLWNIFVDAILRLGLWSLLVPKTYLGHLHFSNLEIPGLCIPKPFHPWYYWTWWALFLWQPMAVHRKREISFQSMGSTSNLFFRVQGNTASLRDSHSSLCN